MVLKNMMLHIQMKKEVAKMSERFPGIDWYCDRCNAYLNDQPGLMTIIMCGSVPNAVIRIVFPLMIFMNQKKTLETITNNLRERKDD